MELPPAGQIGAFSKTVFFEQLSSTIHVTCRLSDTRGHVDHVHYRSFVSIQPIFHLFHFFQIPRENMKVLTFMFSRLGVRPSSTPRAAWPTTSRLRPNCLTQYDPMNSTY